MDAAACSAVADSAWNDVTAAVSAFENKQWGRGVSDLAGAVSRTAQAVSKCGVSELARILEDTASKLGDSALATSIIKAGKATAIVTRTGKEWCAYVLLAKLSSMSLLQVLMLYPLGGVPHHPTRGRWRL